MTLVRFEMSKAFELVSQIKPTANKKAMTSLLSAFLARKKTPKIKGVKIKIAPSFAKIPLITAQSVQRMTKSLTALMFISFVAEFIGLFAQNLRV